MVFDLFSECDFKPKKVCVQCICSTVRVQCVCVTLCVFAVFNVDCINIHCIDNIAVWCVCVSVKGS